MALVAGVGKVVAPLARAGVEAATGADAGVEVLAFSLAGAAFFTPAESILVNTNDSLSGLNCKMNLTNSSDSHLTL